MPSLVELSIDQELERRLFRLGLVGAGSLSLYVAFTLSNAIPLIHSPLNLTLLLLCGAIGLSLLLSAGLPRPPDRLRWLILFACLSELSAQTLIWAQTSNLPALTLADPGLYTELAGKLLLKGHNPFEWDYGGVYEFYRTNQVGSTARLNGAPESNYPYPALPILLVIPFQVLGLPGVLSLSVVAQALTLILLFASSPRSLQLLILLPIMLMGNYTFFTTIGNLDIIWAGLLVGLVAGWRKPVVRALFYGFAIALKQSPWLIAPFLLVRLWHEEKQYRALVRFVGLSGAIFVAVNGPFMLWNFGAWLRCIIEPVQDSLIILSQGGLSSLTHFGLIYLPKSYYLFALAVTLGVLLFCYWRHFDVLRDAFWAMPGIVLWFSYRSLISYWVYWAFPMLATLRVAWDSAPAPKKSWVPTLAAIVMAAAALVGTGVVLAAVRSPIELQMKYPLWTTGGRVTQITVQVTNTSERTLAPRFATQARVAAHNPLSWQIDEGPLTLASGESAVYQLSSQQDDRTFFTNEPAQLIVTDAGGDYALRGVADIEPDFSFLWPDAIINPTYRYWDSYRQSPLAWSLPDGGSASMIENEGRQALALSLEGNQVRLLNTISLPAKPFGLWVYSPSIEGIDYGVELDDGDHRLRVLFGRQSGSGFSEAGVYVIRQTVPSSQWVYQEIDVAAAFAQAGWPLPRLRPANFRGLDTDWRLIDFSLFLSTHASTEVSALFGPIEQPEYFIEPRTLMSESLNDPAGHYLRLGDGYLDDHNYARALEAYQRVLEFAPAEARALTGIEQAQHGLAAEDSQ
jgi:hypothetical protein